MVVRAAAVAILVLLGAGLFAYLELRACRAIDCMSHIDLDF